MGSFFQKKTAFFKKALYIEMAKRVKRNTRKGKRSSRSRRQRGGWQNLTPSNLSAAQGTEYKDIHKGQYGGAQMSMEGAPVGTTGVLDESLRATARVTPLDDSVGAIQGMSDQSGGSRRRGSRRKNGANTGGSRRRRRRGSRRKNGACGGGSRRRRRRHSGGGDLSAAADYSAPTHLLSAGAEAKALMQQNPEWSLAKDPSSFAPKMYGGKRSRRRRGSRRH